MLKKIRLCLNFRSILSLSYLLECNKKFAENITLCKIQTHQISNKFIVSLKHNNGFNILNFKVSLTSMDVIMAFRFYTTYVKTVLSHTTIFTEQNITTISIISNPSVHIHWWGNHEMGTLPERQYKWDYMKVRDNSVTVNYLKNKGLYSK